MEIRVIPSKLKRHTEYIDEEIRVLHYIEEMAELLFYRFPNRTNISDDTYILFESFVKRREILIDLEERLKKQESELQKYVRSRR